MSEDQSPKRWRTYHIHGKGYAEVFGPCAPGSDRIVVDSQEDADLIAAAPELVETCCVLYDLLAEYEQSGIELCESHRAKMILAQVVIAEARGEIT